MSEKKQCVDLYGLGGLALIVPYPTGVIYRNQVAGACCVQMDVEGFVVILDDFIEESLCAKLKKYFNYKSVDEEEDALFIEKTLSEMQGYKGIKVDRERLHESMDAWVYVHVESESSVHHMKNFKAILTWPS